MDSVERRILGFTGMAHFFTHFTMLIFPPLATTIARDLGMSLDDVFELSFIMYLLYGVGAVPWGYVADRWSPRLVLAFGVAIAGAGLIAAGISRNSGGLRWLLASVGLGNAAYHPAGLSLLSRGMRSRGRAMGLNGIFGNLGIASAPFLAGLLGWMMGWRSTFIVFGIAGLLAGLVIIMVPFSAPRSEDRQRANGATGSHAVALFLLACVCVVSAGLMYRSFTLILPSWLETRMVDQFAAIMAWFPGEGTMQSGISTEGLLAALVSGGTMLIGMGGQIAAGKLADRIDLKKGYFGFFVLALPCLLAGRFIPGWTALLFIGLFTFFSLGMQPMENSLYAVLIPPRWRSSGFGIKFTLSFGVGSVAVRIVSALEPGIGLDGVMVLTAVYLGATVLMAAVLLAVGGRTSLKHVHD